MIVTYVLSHLILLLLHMHATAFPEQKVCSRLCFRFLQCFLFVFLLCSFFFSLPCQPPGIPALADPPVGRHLSHFMVSSFSYVLAIFLAS